MRAGLHRLSTLTLGPTSFLQDVLPSMLATPSSYFEENLKQLAQNAEARARELTRSQESHRHPRHFQQCTADDVRPGHSGTTKTVRSGPDKS